MADISIGEAAICLAATCLVSPLLGAGMAVGYMIENHSKENNDRTDRIIAAINGKSAELLSEQQFVSQQSTEYQKNYSFHKNNDCEKPDWMED